MPLLTLLFDSTRHLAVSFPFSSHPHPLAQRTTTNNNTIHTMIDTERIRYISTFDPAQDGPLPDVSNLDDDGNHVGDYTIMVETGPTKGPAIYKNLWESVVGALRRGRATLEARRAAGGYDCGAALRRARKVLAAHRAATKARRARRAETKARQCAERCAQRNAEKKRDDKKKKRKAAKAAAKAKAKAVADKAKTVAWAQPYCDAEFQVRRAVGYHALHTSSSLLSQFTPLPPVHSSLFARPLHSPYICTCPPVHCPPLTSNTCTPDPLTAPLHTLVPLPSRPPTALFSQELSNNQFLIDTFSNGNKQRFYEDYLHENHLRHTTQWLADVGSDATAKHVQRINNVRKVTDNKRIAKAAAALPRMRF